MFNKQLKANIKEIDVKIGKLYDEFNESTDKKEQGEILAQVKELADHRNKLSEVKTRESLLPLIVPAVTGLTAVVAVLHYEKKDIITSKAMAFVTKMFRG